MAICPSEYLLTIFGYVSDTLEEKSLCLSISKRVPPTGTLMSAIDEENKDEDGFLCLAYGGEEKGVCVSYEEL
ncbi:hypothetical protein D8674_022427 [Pyrus ussuriensis x Pyrus communis]|uniref:Autophagy-related protein n=1 Tax=Pyrus ussuriensis x Pyrus communis TaxID=2448454 RepID=A0A5N5GJY4_9ROSA|nr:hypothetical protein D8674_022427 [Pyrus ussuriensis x Pyrus communis]